MTEAAYASVHGGRVHYLEAGEGPPVVCLHQTPRSVDEYRELLPLLARHHRAIAMDTPGMGASTPPADGASIEAYAETVVGLLDALGLDRAHLVGHHTGGVIALEVAARAPDRVDRLVLSSTPWVDDAARRRRAGRTSVDTVEPDDDGGHLVALWRGRQGFYPAGRPDLLTRFVADALRVTDPTDGHRAVGAYRMEDRISLVAAPTLCIGASADPYVFADLDEVAGRIPRARSAVVEGGMVPLLEVHAEQVSLLVTDFLRSP